MLETIREFARDRLDGTDELGTMRDRHARYFHDWALTKREQRTKRDAPFDFLGDDAPNAEQAMGYLVEQPSTDAALELACEMWRSWAAQGRLAEGDDWMTQSLARADQGNLALWEDGLSVAGEFARFRGDHERGLRLKGEAVAIARQLGMLGEVAANLKDMGEIETGRGNLVEARRLIEEALALRRRLGWPHGIAHALVGLSEVELSEARLDSAITVLDEALAIGRAEGLIRSPDTDLGALVLIRLGEAQRRIGNLDLATDLITEGVEVALDLQIVDAVRIGLEEMAAIHAARGDAERATRLLGAATRSLRETGYVDETSTERSLTESALASAMGHDRYQVSFEAGSQMTLAEAVNLALG